MSLLTMLLALAGYIVHVRRDFSRFKQDMPLGVYLRLVKGDLAVTFILTLSFCAILYDLGQLTPGAAFACGYSGESLIRYLNLKGDATNDNGESE